MCKTFLCISVYLLPFIDMKTALYALFSHRKQGVIGMADFFEPYLRKYCVLEATISKVKSIIITIGDLFGTYPLLRPNVMWLVMLWKVRHVYHGKTNHMQTYCSLTIGTHVQGLR